MEAKTIKGGTLRLIDINDVNTPELIEKNRVLYQTGYFFHFDEPENGVKSFRKIYFGNELLDLAKVNPNADFRPVYPVIKFGYDFISQMQGTPNSQCQKATNYLLHTSLIIDDWKNILKSDKVSVIATLSPIEDLDSKQLSWCITKIQWP